MNCNLRINEWDCISCKYSPREGDKCLAYNGKLILKEWSLPVSLTSQSNGWVIRCEVGREWKSVDFNYQFGYFTVNSVFGKYRMTEKISDLIKERDQKNANMQNFSIKLDDRITLKIVQCLPNGDVQPDFPQNFRVVIDTDLKEYSVSKKILNNFIKEFSDAHRQCAYDEFLYTDDIIVRIQPALKGLPVAVLSTTVLPIDGIYEVRTVDSVDIIDIPHYINHPDTKKIVEKLGAIPSDNKL